MLRLQEDGRLVGMARIFWIDFHNGKGVMDMGVGDESDRLHGYGTEALDLLLNFAFSELNLHRISAWTIADNHTFIHIASKAGFKEEALQKEASFHNGHYVDGILMGILRSEWEAR